MSQSDPDRVLALLRQLTDWQRVSGIPPEGSPDVLSLGESNAAIDELKRQLDELGAQYRWSEPERAYQLIDKRPLNLPASERGKE